MIRLYGSGTGLSEDILVKHKDNNIAEIHFKSPIKVMWIDKDVALDIFREKGKWEDDIVGRICTNCRHEFDRELEYICGVDDKCNYVMPNFCPWCGADMREIEEEEEEE